MAVIRRDRFGIAAVAMAIWPVTTVADTLNVPDVYATIQEAIDAAVDGDVVLVADGRYTGAGNRDMDFGGKAVTVISAGGAGACTIDIDGSPGDAHRAFRFHSGEGADSVLEGFTITNGYMAPCAGAILCEAGSAPLIRACKFTNNTVDGNLDLGGGGAIYNDDSDPVIIECEFSGNFVALNNTRTGGAAIYNLNGNPAVTGCTFEQNHVSGPNTATGGGAVANALESFPVFETCQFESNSASTDGGAVINAQGGHSTFTGCTFRTNSAGEAGGAMATFLGSSATIIDCDFIENIASAGGAYGTAGGGMSTFVECDLIDNVATEGAGAVLIQEHTAAFTNCEFTGNTAVANIAGGALVQLLADATFVNCLFADNATAVRGGGVLVRDATADLINCTVTENVAMFEAGGIQAEDGAVVQVTNTIVWNNVPEQITVVGGALNATYSDIQTDGAPWPGLGNINADPMFVDPDSGDYHALETGVTDAGDNCAVPMGVVTDLDGNPRFVDYPGAPDVGNGCESAMKLVDMGPYERQCAADANADGALNILDFVAFQLAWQANVPSADCDGSGTFTILDFICFQQLFQSGCP